MKLLTKDKEVYDVFVANRTSMKVVLYVEHGV